MTWNAYKTPDRGDVLIESKSRRMVSMVTDELGTRLDIKTVPAKVISKSYTKLPKPDLIPTAHFFRATALEMGAPKKVVDALFEFVSIDETDEDRIRDAWVHSQEARLKYLRKEIKAASTELKKLKLGPWSDTAGRKRRGPKR